MTTPRRDPYDLLIQQFLQNIQQGSQAVERRFQGQREERLVGEERDFQTGLIEDQREYDTGVRAEERDYQTDVRAEGRGFAVEDANRRWVEGVQVMEMEAAREDAVAARERSNRLREQAHQYRLTEAQNLRQLLAFLDPESAEYEEASRVFQAMMRPISEDIPGEQALANATSGMLILDDGSQVDFHGLIGRYSYLARDAEADVAIRDAARQTILDYLGSGVSVEAKREYYNTTVAENDLLFNDDSRRYALALVGIHDPDAQADALAARQLVAAQTQATLAGADASRASAALAGVQTARGWFDLNEARSLSSLRREEAELIVAERRQSIDATDTEIFLETGIIPTNVERASRLATSLRMTPEQLAVAGQSRFKRLQAREDAALRLQVNQAELLGAQVDAAEIATMMSELEYNNEVFYGAIRDKASLAEVAYTFALNGNEDGLRTLESLSLLEDYQEALGGMDFPSLLEIAGDVRLSAEEARFYDRVTREANTGTAVLAYQGNRAGFLDTVATTFLTSDFSVDAEGNFTNLQADVQDYVDGFSANELRAMGTTSEELARDVMRSVIRAKSMEDRNEAIGSMEALINAAPTAGPQVDEDGRPTGPVTGALTAEQQRWKSTFMTQASLADVDLEVAEQIADGVLRTGNLEYFTAMLDAEHTQSQIDVNLANARRTNFETDLLEEEEELEGVMLDGDMYSDMRLGIESMMGSLETRLNSAYCTVSAAAGGQELNTENAEECLSLVADLEFYEYELRNLTHAYATQSPYSYGAFIGGMTTPIVRSAEVAATIDEWGDSVRSDLLGEVEANRPDVVATLYEAIAEGGITNADEFNGVLAEASQRIRSDAAEGARMMASIESIDFASSDWREMSDAAKLGRLARAPEWRDLAVGVAGGRELTRGEEEQLARQFGWTTEGLIIGSRFFGAEVPAWLQGPGMADVEGFRRALGTTVQEINRQGDVTGAEGLGTPGGPAMINGEVNPALMTALVQQESGSQHRGGGLARGTDNLTESHAGALGITQIMPATGWQPGLGVTPVFKLDEEDDAEMRRLNVALGSERVRRREALAAGDVAQAEEAKGEIDRINGEMLELVRPYAESVPESEFLRFGRDYLGALLRQFDGDVEKAVAAYNTGAGNVLKAVEADPENWLAHLSDETVGYVPNIMAMFNRQ